MRTSTKKVKYFREVLLCCCAAVRPENSKMEEEVDGGVPPVPHDAELAAVALQPLPVLAGLSCAASSADLH